MVDLFTGAFTIFDNSLELRVFVLHVLNVLFKVHLSVASDQLLESFLWSLFQRIDVSCFLLRTFVEAVNIKEIVFPLLV